MHQHRMIMEMKISAAAGRDEMPLSSLLALPPANL
jgi:hypothetical protein